MHFLNNELTEENNDRWSGIIAENDNNINRLTAGVFKFHGLDPSPKSTGVLLMGLNKVLSY